MTLILLLQVSKLLILIPERFLTFNFSQTRQPHLKPSTTFNLLTERDVVNTSGITLEFAYKKGKTIPSWCGVFTVFNSISLF